MAPFEFLIVGLVRLPIGMVVSGRCGETQLGVGDVFTELRWSVWERREPPLLSERTSESVAAKVQLRVEQISCFDTSLDHLSAGYSAGLLLGGDGLALLAGIDFDADFRAGKSWSLWGKRSS